ncbi:MAG: hypothetical protein WBL72_06180 [Thermoguttaceae bacterium]
MKHPPKLPAADIGRGSVRGDELIDLRTFGRRLGLGPRVLCDLQRAGLKTVLLGRKKFLIGKWVLEFCERQANGQGGQTE